MSADDLIHLISNQALNKEINENHKLVIQDCCKELFKKKETIKKYRKITYLHSKVKFCDEEQEYICQTKTKTRIVEIEDNNNCGDFPEKLHHSCITRHVKYVTLHNSGCHDQTFTIIEMEDI